MARADLLKVLFKSYQGRDEASFKKAAQEIIHEERRKHHIILANELERILQDGSYGHPHDQRLFSFETPPQDADKRIALAEVRQPSRYLVDLVLPDVIKARVYRIMDEFRDWNVLESNGLAPTRRVLFCGPSGCGKTATAEAIAAELSLPLLYVRFDAVVSSLLGETAANLRKIFDYARRGQWVLFFDEFDAIGRSRDDETEHGEIKRLVNSYLQLVDNFRGRSLVIAATNFERSLDPAVWRRFDDVIRFNYPMPEELRDLVTKLLRPLAPSVDQIRQITLAISGSSYAEAERVCHDIRKTLVLRGGSKIAERDLAEAIDRHHYRQQLMKASIEAPLRTIDRE